MEASLPALIDYLKAERPGVDLDTSLSAFDQYRSLVNTRPAQPASPAYLAAEGQVLEAINQDLPHYDWSQMTERWGQIALWQGNICQLAVDGIVNAANSQLLGCFIPLHACIDNIIHSYAGTALRLECQELMARQGRLEAAGKAKLTSAHHLPSRYILHTVGPVVQDGRVTPIRRQLLAQCYRSCLDLADQEGLTCLAFPCIATGQFAFPKEEAARIAVDTVSTYLSEQASELKIIFNVFTDEDDRIYRQLLGEETNE
ncbi:MULTISPECIES: protein-ADP-ribose hydrolase [unclassified Aerococcus]|uniref:protein-ADP-ribose hydrolase n=1 Tax=unclassified Aerococcus TaxID=2618060 RepID=UPI0008A31608|nr:MULTISPECIES: protein-ADP-ribose hydrolase [unclassified Aerococcus]MDK6368702.1 protein-ADP-ribose hydrolase [Aerococcus sp. UMB9870]MDK6679250.1 protein-ADP-ribose hydrolase [Aerococcus sp. UMB8608]MDK6685908.1 protein-ADP-ribose hydrolase [Aerococcus sp. UMB8623]MDK6939325.1 protein-ADP-ribose hydrolase [Aerococcus sp. UMB8487]OFK19193.1 hypothetical protein HMPREF2829_01280 [Aerococcus sp. HMSC072A12]